jgi:hypothetical protein
MKFADQIGPIWEIGPIPREVTMVKGERKPRRKSINIGDTDENADWIKTPENRESERRIHDELAKRLKEGRTMPVVEAKYRGSKEYFLVYSELIRAARYKGVTTYQAIAQMIGLPLKGSHMGSELGQILGEILEDELNRGRPMLTALVVSSVDGMPGSGFFKLAREFGKLHDDSKDAERDFWEQEKEAVYAEWKREFKA